MKTKFIFLVFIMFALLPPQKSFSQDSIIKLKHSKVKTIWDIPHKTNWEKWMWIHRSFAFQITKERKINYDTAYISSYYRRLVITLPLSTRFLKFSLIDPVSGNKLVFAPNLQYNLGISVSSRWASFIVNSGVKLFHGDNSTKGKTSFQDYQLNLYGRKFTTDMFVQFYSGFYIRNSKSFNAYTSDAPYLIRKDINALHLGVNSYYIINHKRFSYGNSFAFVEQQKKSAGSLLVGLYYSYFDVTGSPSIVSEPFRSSFDSLSFIRSGHSHSFGLNLGYIYTLVFLKKCYATASAVQGIGAEQLVYVHDDNSIKNRFSGGAGKLNIRLALGYDNGRYFVGAMGMTDYYLLRGKSSSTFDYSLGKVMVYIGYRFSVLKTEKKILRHFKLTNY